LIVGALSHPGEQRDHNEDRFSVTAYQLSDSQLPSLVAIVADGIGGHQAGEIASGIVVDSVESRLRGSSGRDPLPTMRAAVSDAAHAVMEAARQDQAREGMGSTLALVWILADKTYITYVGDSRIYLLRADKIRQLSNDHTWVQEALDHEIISPDEAEGHPHAHVLRRHIGGQKPPEPDLRVRLGDDPSEPGSSSFQGFPLQANDQLLLCSDGLTDLVEADEIAALLRSREPGPAVQRLVEMARRRGGHDNITVVALKVPRQGVPLTPQPRRRWSALGLLLAAAVGLLLAIVASRLLGVWPWRRGPGPQGTATAAAAMETPSKAEAGEVLNDATPTTTPTPLPTSTAVPLATVAGG
jgi:protein phosphatase